MNKKVVGIIVALMLVVALSVVLVACTNPSAESLEEKLKDAGYEVTIMKGEDLDVVEVSGLEWIVWAVKEDTEDAVFIYKFEKASDAKDAMSKVEEAEDEEYEISRSGSYIYVGTKDGMKAAK